MSFWTSIRNAVESVAAVAGNFVFPGSGLVTSQLVSKGSQQQLGSTLGQLAMMGSGIAGGATGNMSNYGSAMDMLSGNPGTINTPLGAFTSGGAGAGISGGAAGGDISVAQRLIENGVDPMQAIQMANVAPAAAENAGLTAGAGRTWADIATEAGIPYATPAGPSGPGGAPQGGMIPGEVGAQAQMDALSAARGAANVGPGQTGLLAKLTGGTGAMPWGSAGNIMQMGTGLYGIMESRKLQEMAKQAQSQADPFGPYRQQYAQQMSALSANPSLMTSLPGYQAGLDAVQRSMAAQGYTGSGNMMAALSKYGGDFYNQTMGMYGNLAGAGFNPANSAQIGLQGQGLGANLMMNSLGMLGKGVTMAGS